MMIIVYKDKDGKIILPVDLTPFIEGESFTYTVCNEENVKVAEGETAAVGEIGFDAPKDSLYMLVVKAK